MKQKVEAESTNTFLSWDTPTISQKADLQPRVLRKGDHKGHVTHARSQADSCLPRPCEHTYTYMVGCSHNNHPGAQGPRR